MKSIVPGSLLVLVAIACGAAPVRAQILSDGFESYPLGNFTTVGPWTDFGGDQPVAISNTQAHSGTRSLRLSEGLTPGATNYGSDVWVNYQAGLITSGVYNFSFWNYVEPSVDSLAILYLSTQLLPAGFQNGLEIYLDPINANGLGSGVVAGQSGIQVGSTVPLVTGAWSQHSLTINLDQNTYSYSYNGTQIANNLQWDRTPGDGVTLGGLNFWMDEGNTNGTNGFVYFDDFSLTPVPEPSSFALVGLAGGWAWRFRRRKAAGQ